jgi:hypothetical protein
MKKTLKNLAVLAALIVLVRMIDYGRGLPVTMMPFVIIAPAVFNTLDYESAWKQLADYGKLVLRGMAQSGRIA